MTEQQAIKIRSIFSNRIPQEELYTKLTDELATEIDNAITKQVPMECKMFKDTCVCGKAVYPHMNYCSNCGQKLDWGKNNANKNVLIKNIYRG